ncbi:MAG: Gfo/Idh/MocA family oxidoreductase [Chloroflexi bacterium]|nr:Gfo/Idh/MocA family oxidoreductase [Chloroflexota bacterium]
MVARIGIGIISFAHGHAQAYCQRMLSYDDVKLVACWDDDEGRGQQAADDYGMIYSAHVEDVLNHPHIQGVIVTCETNRHAEMVLAAAAAGKDILCQKPMALTLADCDRMAAAVEQAGVRFMMAYQMRRDPSNIKLKEIFDSGVLGTISLLRRRHCIPVLLDQGFIKGKTRWHFDPDKNMGMFMDDASHATDFIHWVMGKPISVMAEIQNTVTDFSPDDTGVAIYRFANGAMAVLLNASVTLAGENTTEIYGDQGVLIQNHDDAPSTNVPLPSAATALKLYTRTQPTWQDLNVPIPDDHGERIAGVPRAFVDCLMYDRDPDITAEDGRISVEMILAAYQSAREGRRVTFPLHDAGYREVGGSGNALPNNKP